MAQRERLPSRRAAWLLLATIVLLGRCGDRVAPLPVAEAFVPVDLSGVPETTVPDTDPKLSVVNGIYYFTGTPFSGHLVGRYANGTVKFTGSYFQGKQHGITKTYYPDGKLRDQRSYRANIGYGRHFGFWENGKMKFDFFYVDDKWEGVQKQWYPNGQPYLCLRFRNDRENGMQKGWRQNGKLFVNYEARDGIRYGLQKANLCYTLRNQQVNLK